MKRSSLYILQDYAVITINIKIIFLDCMLSFFPTIQPYYNGLFSRFFGESYTLTKSTQKRLFHSKCSVYVKVDTNKVSESFIKECRALRFAKCLTNTD